MKSLIAKHFEEHYETFVKKVRGRSGGEYNAEDVVAEAYSRALQYAESYNQQYPFENWFGTILNNSLKDFKNEERYGGTFVELEESHIFTDAERHYFNRLADEIREEVEKVKGTIGQVLNMYFVLGYKRRDIQKVLDLPRTTVDFYIKTFRDKMKRKYPEENSSRRS